MSVYTYIHIYINWCFIIIIIQIIWKKKENAEMKESAWRREYAYSTYSSTIRPITSYAIAHVQSPANYFDIFFSRVYFFLYASPQLLILSKWIAAITCFVPNRAENSSPQNRKTILLSFLATRDICCQIFVLMTLVQKFANRCLTGCGSCTELNKSVNCINDI